MDFPMFLALLTLLFIFYLIYHSDIKVFVNLGAGYYQFYYNKKNEILTGLCMPGRQYSSSLIHKYPELDEDEICAKIHKRVSEDERFINIYNRFHTSKKPILGERIYIKKKRGSTYITYSKKMNIITRIHEYDFSQISREIESLVANASNEIEEEILNKSRKELSKNRELFREYLHDKTKDLPSHIQVFLNDEKFGLTKKIEDRNIFFDKAFEYYLMSISNQVVRYYNKSTGQHEHASIAHISMINSEIIVEFKKMINERLVENWRDILQYEWSDSKKYSMSDFRVYDYDEVIFSYHKNQGMRIKEGVFVLDIYGLSDVYDVFLKKYFERT